jgi:hypothetical protein
MDIDYCDQTRHTQLEAQLSIQHVCNHNCKVEHLFGNTYQCVQSRLLHVCDQTCDKRIQWDRYSTICLLSKKRVELSSEQQQQQTLADR